MASLGSQQDQVEPGEGKECVDKSRRDVGSQQLQSGSFRLSGNCFTSLRLCFLSPGLAQDNTGAEHIQVGWDEPQRNQGGTGAFLHSFPMFVQSLPNPGKKLLQKHQMDLPNLDLMAKVCLPLALLGFVNDFKQNFIFLGGGEKGRILK